MARARNIKPGFFTNDMLAELPALTRLFFAGLWTVCDRAGRVEDRPKKIKAEVMPYDDCDPDQVIEQLRKSGFIARYEADGVRVIQVLTWEKHQNPHVKEAASTLPALCEHGASTVLAPDSAQPSPERAGRIPDSGFRIPDSLIPDTGYRIDAAQPAPVAVPAPEPKALGVDFLVSQGCDPAHASDWIKARKAKRAPLTATAWAGIVSEAAKAGMTPAQAVKTMAEKSWQGFNADWLRPHERGSPRPANAEDRNAEAARLLGFSTGDVIDA